MLAERLRKLRLESGLQQTELAERLGLAQSHISRIENGTPTTTKVLEAWLEACGGRLSIAGPETGDPLGPLLGVVSNLSPADVARLVRVARALPQLRERTADVLTAAFEGAAEDGRS